MCQMLLTVSVEDRKAIVFCNMVFVGDKHIKTNARVFNINCDQSRWAVLGYTYYVSDVDTKKTLFL